MKNILFLVTGMTPQIITETVWALACAPDVVEPWVPDEIHVMSTEDGLTQIRSRLFSEKEGFRFKKFKQDYPQLQDIKFDGSQHYLHAIKNDKGEELNDLRTPTDNEVAANVICAKVREFTLDEEVNLHVSIAGGRKTMGFYAGYALSLYGRAQDTMSHVLVEERYESARDFFYPTTEDNVFVTNRDGVELKASEAQVWLANIPFVRMRDAIIKKHQIKQDTSFSSVVSKINESFKEVKLTINTTNKEVVVNDKFVINDLLPAEFALLHWFADRRSNNQAGIVAPTANINSKDMSTEQFNYIMQISEDYMKFYNQVKDELWRQDYETGDVEAIDIDKKFFEVKKSNLKSKFQKALGIELASKIEIKNDKKGEPFYLDLAPEAIEIVGLSTNGSL